MHNAFIYHFYSCYVVTTIIYSQLLTYEWAASYDIPLHWLLLIIFNSIHTYRFCFFVTTTIIVSLYCFYICTLYPPFEVQIIILYIAVYIQPYHAD